MKPRISYAEAFPALDFEHMDMGTPLLLESEKVKFAGWHFGQVWIKVRGRNVHLPAGDPRIGHLRLYR